MSWKEPDLFFSHSSTVQCQVSPSFFIVHRAAVNQFHVDVTSSGSTAPHYSGYNATISIDVRYRLLNVYTRSVCTTVQVGVAAAVRA